MFIQYHVTLYYLHHQNMHYSSELGLKLKANQYSELLKNEKYESFPNKRNFKLQMEFV